MIESVTEPRYIRLCLYVTTLEGKSVLNDVLTYLRSILCRKSTGEKVLGGIDFSV